MLTQPLEDIRTKMAFLVGSGVQGRELTQLVTSAKGLLSVRRPVLALRMRMLKDFLGGEILVSSCSWAWGSVHNMADLMSKHHPACYVGQRVTSWMQACTYIGDTQEETCIQGSLCGPACSSWDRPWCDMCQWRVIAVPIEILDNAVAVCTGHDQVPGVSAAEDMESGGSGGTHEGTWQRSAPAFTSADCSLSACLMCDMKHRAKQ